ncbi:hypothetical protein ACLOJK_006519 [Asimina triloba]
MGAWLLVCYPLNRRMLIWAQLKCGAGSGSLDAARMAVPAGGAMEIGWPLIWWTVLTINRSTWVSHALLVSSLIHVGSRFWSCHPDGSGAGSADGVAGRAAGIQESGFWVAGRAVGSPEKGRCCRLTVVRRTPNLGKMGAVSSCRSSDLSRRPLLSVMVGLDLPVGHSSVVG